VAGRGWRRTLIPGDGPLAMVPPVAAFVLVAALFAAGVLVGGAVGALLLGLLAVLVGLLLAAAWPRLRPQDRAMRLIVLLVVVAVAALQLS
jgi:chromate transport protein ChrA